MDAAHRHRLSPNSSPISRSARAAALRTTLHAVQLDANDDGVAWITGYTADQLAAVPAPAAEISLGCGNPGALASLRPGEVVLDIGSGGGIDAFFAARRVGSEGRVIGLDMTPAMIARARKTADESGLDQRRVPPGPGRSDARGR